MNLRINSLVELDDQQRIEKGDLRNKIEDPDLEITVAETELEHGYKCIIYYPNQSRLIVGYQPTNGDWSQSEFGTHDLGNCESLFNLVSFNEEGLTMPIEGFSEVDLS